MTRINRSGPITSSFTRTPEFRYQEPVRTPEQEAELEARLAEFRAKAEQQRATQVATPTPQTSPAIPTVAASVVVPALPSGIELHAASMTAQATLIDAASNAQNSFESDRRSILETGFETHGLTFMLSTENTDLKTGQPKPIGDRRHNAKRALMGLPLETRATTLIELAQTHKDDANALLSGTHLGEKLETVIRGIGAAPDQAATLAPSSLSDDRVTSFAVVVIGLLEHRGGQGVAIQKLSDLHPNDQNAVLQRVGKFNPRAANQLEGLGLSHKPIAATPSAGLEIAQAGPPSPTKIAQELVKEASYYPSKFGAAFVAKFTKDNTVWKLSHGQTLEVIAASFALIRLNVAHTKSLRHHLIAAKLATSKEIKKILIPIDEPTLTLDAFLEQIATNLVYSNLGNLETQSADLAPTYDADKQQNTEVPRRGSNPKAILEHFGYKATNVTIGKWGLQLRLFTPTGKNPKYTKAILAFRGTESVMVPGGKPSGPVPDTQMDTAIADFSGPAGYAQFKQNKALIERNLEFADQQTKTGKPIVTGHSLGGALAQITAATFPSHTGEVVTFMSPAINQTDVNRLEQHNKTHGDAEDVKVRHYRVSGDIVPTTGDAMLTGSLTTFNRQQLAPSENGMQYAMGADFLQTAHTTHPLAHLIRQFGSENPDQAIIEAYGAHDPKLRTDPAVKDVNISVTDSRDLATEKDPRVNLNAGKPLADDLYLEMKIQTFLMQLPYHLLIEGIEPFAMNSKDYKTFEGQALEWLSKQSKLRIQNTQAFELSKDIKLEERAEEFAYERPWVGTRLQPLAVAYLKAKTDGVQINGKAKTDLQRNIRATWDAFRPT